MVNNCGDVVQKRVELPATLWIGLEFILVGFEVQLFYLIFIDFFGVRGDLEENGLESN